jgi:cyclopropane-fatty-acyl-phospholipid synthase
MSVVPNALIQSCWLSALDRIARGRLDFVGPAGEDWTFGGSQPGPHATMQIHEWDVIERLAARGDIGLGEDYIAGAWDTDDLEALITLFLLNMDQLEAFANGNLANRLLFVLHDLFVRRNSVSGSRRNIQSHYDMGNDFFSLWLDETMTYSSALFAGQAWTLADAQREKYRRILSKLPTPRASILEIGCGWGGFAEQATDAGFGVTGLTISPAQYAFAARRLGSRADIRLQDYRKVQGTFDSVVSIEMFEAVGEHYWPRYFHTIAANLVRGGRALVQSIVIRDEIFAAYRTRSDFVRHYVFPGGMLPSLSRFREEAERAGLKLLGSFAFGQDYARTLREWSTRMRAREEEILALGRDRSFLRNWQFFFGLSAAAFAVGRTNVIQAEFVRA